MASRMDRRQVDLGFGAEGAQVNALRCYLCDHKYEIDQDRCIHCDWCIRVAPRACIHRVADMIRRDEPFPTAPAVTTLPEEGTYIWIDADQCIRCGNCLRVCPTGAISCRRGSLEKAATPGGSRVRDPRVNSRLNAALSVANARGAR